MLLRLTLPSRFAQYTWPAGAGVAAPGKSAHWLAKEAGAVGRAKQFTLMYVRLFAFQFEFTGLQPGTVFGKPNWSAPEFCRPKGSSEMIGVVGTPLLIVKMPPSSHPPSAVFAIGPSDFGAGISHKPLIDMAWRVS